MLQKTSPRTFFVELIEGKCKDNVQDSTLERLQSKTTEEQGDAWKEQWLQKSMFLNRSKIQNIYMWVQNDLVVNKKMNDTEDMEVKH